MMHAILVEASNIGPSSGNLAWIYKTKGWLSAPVIGAQGTVYVGSSDGTLYAIEPDGNLKWKPKSNNGVGSACVGADGTIFFCSENGTLFAVNEDVAIKWSYSSGYNSYSVSPIIDMTRCYLFWLR